MKKITTVFWQPYNMNEFVYISLFYDFFLKIIVFYRFLKFNYLYLQGDIGGQRTLQRKWTSFLKAQLMCSFPEYELQFNILRGVYVMEGPHVHDSIVFAVFGLEW